MKRTENFLLILIFLGSFLIRLYKIDGPIADWHSWRQADTAAVARNFLKFGFDPLRPRYDDLSNVQSGFDNPKGYRMVEFPVYQILGSGLYQVLKILPGMTIEIALRLISVISSIGIMVILYKLTRKELGFWGSLGGLGIFGVLPYSVFYSRAILPEMTAVCFALGAVWVGSRWETWGKWGIWGTGILAGLAVLTKPTAGFLLLPIGYFAIKNWRWSLGYLSNLGILGIITLGPLIWGTNWSLQCPEGIAGNLWLLNGNNIRFTPAFFRWLLFERLTKLILGYGLVIPFITGTIVILKKIKTYRSHMTYMLLMMGTVLYAFVFATGNVQHDYYQILWLPALAVFTGMAFSFSGLKGKMLMLVLLLLSAKTSWDNIQGYYWINNLSMLEAGKMVDKITPQNAKVIAPYGGDTAFLYQTKRQGWPVGFEIEKKIEMGADYYVNTNVNDAETKYVMEKWKTVIKNDKYVIVKLQ